MESPDFKKYFSWLLVVIAIIVFINLPRIRDNFLISGLRQTLVSITYPVQFVARTTANFVYFQFSNFTSLYGAAAQNIRLREEVALYKAQSLAAQRLAAENADLNRALGFYKNNYIGKLLLPAKIISYGDANLFGAILINRGGRHGVKINTAVISSAGLVGRVDEVFPYTARVLLISDPSSAVSVINGRTRDFGVLGGRGLNQFSLQFVPTSAKVEVGDALFTSGRSDLYPPGILVGKIIGIHKNDYDIFQSIQVSPAVDFSKLNLVFLIR